MRIISGLWRGRQLIVPDVGTTRPTMDRTREAVFGMLRAREAIVDARVLDVFAGSGAYGFEALSQGAAHVTFFEKNQTAVKAIHQNAEKLDCTSQVVCIGGDVARAPSAQQTATLAFFDPPYEANLLSPALAYLKTQGWITPDTLLVLEMKKDEEPPTDLNILDTRHYGTSKIILAYINQ